MTLRTELRKALAEARPYLLSHHVLGRRYRCYSLSVFGRRVHLCARCSGVYPGILAGLLAHLGGPSAVTGLAVIALVPMPALVDWAMTTFTDRRGSNVVRTATGVALGYGYGLGLGRLLDGDWRVLAVGLAYALIAGLLVAAERR